MLHRLLFFILLLFVSLNLEAQPAWQWATTTPVTYNINPSYPRMVVASHKGQTTWGTIHNRKMTHGQVMLGDYTLLGYAPGGGINRNCGITGKLSFTAARNDSAGNVYLLGTFYDSVNVGNAKLLVRTTAGSEHFLLRLSAGSLSPDWLVPVGSNAFCGTDCFTIEGDAIYLPIDSSNTTSIARFDAATGARTTLWSQTGRSSTAYIDADPAGNIYLMGHCVLTGGISFNGTPSPPPAGAQYPWYIARYRSGGQHHWHYWLTDMTCLSRSFTLGGPNAVYLSGALADTTSLGAHHFSKPAGFFNADFMIARLDSNGSLVWAQQRPVTSISQGGVFFSSQYHMAATDTALYMFCETQGASIWGGGVATQTNNNRHNGTIVAYDAGGGAKWARTIGSNYSLAQHIFLDGDELWVTGVGADSVAIRFDSVHIPTGNSGYIPYLAGMKLSQSGATTSIYSPAAASNFSAWPNPAKTMLHARGAGGMQLTVRDITGRVIMQRVADESGVTILETGNWPRGWYLLEGSDSRGRSVIKVLLN